ncbi:MAG: helix-turn-helix domain-containing protein [Anaerolineales bacterium]|nr:helix-turn-helix domain-containing protein [Anaerolineales bacterium]
MKPETTEDVLDLLDAHSTAAALGAAMQLGLFWLLTEQTLSASDIADALGIPAYRCRYWLQVLSRSGLLEETSSGYAASPTARRAILGAYSQSSWALLAEEAGQRSHALRDLALHIPDPGPAPAAQETLSLDYVARMSESADRARRFTRMLYEIHGPLADRLAALLDLSSATRLMDLGGGSGVVSMALLRRYPHLTAVVVDIENVCKAGRELAAENSLEDRITFHAADVLRDKLLSGFDVVLECDVNVYTEALFRKVRAALSPGGRFFIVDYFAPARGVAPPSRAHWALERSLSDPEFSYPSAAAAKSLLEEVGFRVVAEGTLSAHGETPSRYASGLSVIEACT